MPSPNTQGPPLSSCDRLRILPPAAARWIELALGDALASPDALELARCEPALALEVLRAAARSRAADDVSLDLAHAHRVAGRTDWREHALRVEIGEPADPKDTGASTLERLRDHAVACAAAAREIAPALGCEDSESAYAAGLLRSFGAIALSTLDPRAFDEIAAWAGGATESEVAVREIDRFGTDRNALALALAGAWGLPAPLRTVLALAAGPNAEIEQRSEPSAVVLAQIARAAAALASDAGMAGVGRVYLEPDAARAVSASERNACHAAMRRAVERAREIGRPHAADDAALCALLRRAHALVASRLAASERRRRAEEAVNAVLRFALEQGVESDPVPGVLAHAVGALQVGRLTYVEKDIADRSLRVGAAAASPGLAAVSQRASVPFPVERELAAEPRIVRREEATNEEFLLLELLGVSSCAVAPVRAVAQQKRGYICADSGPAGRAPEPGVERCVGLIADQASLLSKLEQVAREKERLALQDPLTGVATRRRMMDRLEFLLHQTQRTGHPVSVLMIEVDHLAQVNDSLGPKIGDRWLQEVAAVLASNVRKTDLVARYTGPGFAVVLPSCPIEGARSLAEDLRRTVFERGAQSRDLYGGMSVSVSVGAACNVEGDTPPALLARADSALRAAMRGGANRVEAAA